MTTLTYKQAFDKITEAYIKGEIKPFDSDFCFCGTLASGRSWVEDKCPLYSRNDFVIMEAALLMQFYSSGYNVTRYGRGPAEWAIAGADESTPYYEEILFAGMCAALEVLKQIHIERGEIIDETPAFTKRQLQPA